MTNGQPVRVNSALGEDLMFSAMDLTEELGRLFRCELELLSPKEDIELDDLLGQDMIVEIDLPKGGTRYVHGWVSEMAQTGRHGEYASYMVVLRPWLWFLTRTADCKIFQELTAPDIIKEVLRENGFSDFRDDLTGSYRTWEYCVQYRETDFNFVSRLMEQEGIYYFFEHEEDKDVLVLVDADSCHSAITDYETIPYYPPSANVVREEHIFDWRLSRSVNTGTYGLSAFHFKKPRANLEVYKSITRQHSRADYEFFDYPGEYFETSEGETYVAARIEELQARYERVRGETDAMGLYPGGLFTLAEYPREDQNHEYLVVAVHHGLTLGDYASGSGQRGLEYSCNFEALDSKCQFRAERITPKPFVQGPQTAIVVGPSSEEIHTDEYGRIKVQFKWDRYGTWDENSSCWVRVAQAWAGTQWGGVTIPRIGQEVIVDFIEGDPDRPIVTGRVYNADNMPPYGLPDNKTQSGIKSRSSKGGGADNFNEIRFEDKKGSEELHIQAEKDETITVKNDKTENVGANETITIGKDRQETVQGNETLTVVKDRTRTVSGSETVNVARTRSHNVMLNESINVGAAQEIAVGGFQALEVGAFQNFDVGLNQSMGIGRNQEVDVGKNRTVSVGENDDLKVEKDLVIDVGEQVTLKCGKASITMKKDGTVTISGKDLSLKASGKVGVKASSDVKIKGSKVQAN